MTTEAAVAAGRVSLRPSTTDDRELLVRVYGSTRAEELARVPWTTAERDAFIRMQFDAQDAHYRQHNPDAGFAVIEVDGHPAGRWYVDRRPDDIRVIDVALLPEFRGRGIGTSLLRGVMGEAADTGRSVSIHVEVHNRAADLYHRLGFEAVAEVGIYRLMNWRAS